MKHFYAFLLACASMMSIATAQNVNIPDANFKNVLVNNPCANLGTSTTYTDVDTNNDGEIQLSEAAAVTKMYVTILNVYSLVGIQSFTSLTYLKCSSNYLASLDVQGLTSLRHLDCSNNQLSTLNVQGLTSLDYLNCSYNTLSTLDVQGLTSLDYLDCTQSQLTSLNVQGLTNLDTLYCSLNQLSTLDVQGLTSLTHLHCFENQLSTLNVQGLMSLTHLSCSNNQLSTLDMQGLTSLHTLACSNNQLSTLDVQGLTSLFMLYCSNNQLSTLDLQGLTNLNRLECFENQLSTLNLQGLTSLSKIYCYQNQLSTLDIQGLTNLTDISCQYNQLSTLDVQSLTSLAALYCHANNLTSLFIKNGKYENLAFENNPNLTYICCDTTEIDNINAKITQYGYTNCVVNSYCSFTPGGVFYTIEGNNTFDTNNNGCDSSDIAFSFLKFDITDNINTGIFVSDANGVYNMPVQAGTHTITPELENPSYFFVSPSSVQVSFPASASPFVSNFCITPNGVHQDVEVTILPLTPARPGFDATYRLLYKNIGNIVVSDSLIFRFEDDKMDFVSATVAPILSGDSLIWTFSNLQPFESRSIDIVLNINSPMEIPPVNAGDVLSFQAIVCPSNNSENGFFSLQQTVVGSYDPNDKTCLEGNEITPDKVGEYLHYLIRFENTGTYFAENIVIKDVIDTTVFDLASLQITESSHNCYMRSVQQNQMEFIFENIQLPFTDPGKHGFVAFKIKTKDNLTIGTQLKNQADIFFDYNFPIITNVATTEIVYPASLLHENIPTFDVFVLPNPATDLLRFQTSSIIEKCEIFDHLGRVVQTSSIDKQEVNIAHLPKGLYYVKMYSTNGVALQKFTKM